MIKDACDFNGICLVRLHPDGTIVGTLPEGITVTQLDTASLLAGQQVTGKSGNLIYSAIPTPVRRVTGYTPVLIITRVAQNPANGVRYFLFVAAVLVLAAIVAWALARRFSRPLVAAVGATRRIACGDLEATVPTAKRGTTRNSRQLAEAINAMAVGLSGPGTRSGSSSCPCPTSSAPR